MPLSKRKSISTKSEFEWSQLHASHSMADSLLKRLELVTRRAFLRMLERRDHATPSVPWTEARLLSELGPTPTILFLRQDRLGDVIMSTPIMIAIRDRFPAAKMILLLGKNNTGAIPLLPFPMEIAVYRKSILKDWSTIRRLRKQKIDLVIDLTDKASVTSSLLVGFVRGKIALGIEKQNDTVYDITVPRLDQESVHVARRIAELLRPLGIDPDRIDLRPRIGMTTESRIPGRVGFNITARVEERCAPTEPSAVIARTITELRGVGEVIILFDPREVERAKEIVRLASSPQVHLARTTTSFLDFARLISTCEYLITTDTSVVQIAAALDIPMLVLANPTPGEHFWTPQGVLFELWEQRPALRELEPQPAIRLFTNLVRRHTTAMDAKPQFPS